MKSKWTLAELDEIQAITAQARKALAEVDKCQEQLRSKGIKAYIDGESKFVVSINL